MSTTIDETRVEAFVGQIASEIGATLNAALVTLGDDLGLYRAMADGQPVGAAELASRTDTHERYVREWLNAQAAGGYVDYDPEGDSYTLPAEHAFVLADEQSPLAMAGMFQSATASVDGRRRVAERFRDGGGVGWHEHDHGIFCGVERAWGSNYRANLLTEWLPALDGVVEKLERGARVADVGCGHGLALIMLAEAFPSSTFVGYDYHRESILAARERAAEAGVSDRVSFEVAGASDFPGQGFDLVCFFDSLHDLGDPTAAIRRTSGALAADGTCLIVEPFAGDSIEENLNPVGRLFYGYSTLLCTPGSLSQPGAAGLGTQAGEKVLTEVIEAGGLRSVERVAESAFNLVLEARR